MIRPAIGPGDDVEAWCTRCRMNLNHRVIAVVGRLIQRVQCLTCGGDHKYYPPKGLNDKEPAKRVLKAASPEKTKKSLLKAADRAEGEWSTFMKEMGPGTEAKPYKVTESFQEGDFVDHKTFGLGRVLDVIGAEKIQCIFKDGRKVLLFNRKN
jgi:hypothetical protein